jgi:thiamine-phosphate pyrophosphorylase
VSQIDHQSQTQTGNQAANQANQASNFSDQKIGRSPQPHLTICRILDANLDRAREGLRVIEEWCRFGLEDGSLSAQCKDLRQELAQWHSPQIKAARNTPDDPGTSQSHSREEKRLNIESVLSANCSRTQEALRVLEEYGKLLDPAMAKAFKQIRYRTYTLETAIGKASQFNMTNQTDQTIGINAIKKTNNRVSDHPLNSINHPMSNLHQTRLQKLSQAGLYLVTLPHERILEIVEAALKGGLSLVQYRDKDANDRDRLAIAMQLCELCHHYDAIFLVNDRVDIALAVGADGVHVGQQDLPPTEARKILGADYIIGQSTTSPAELAISLNAGVDYVGVGPVFATPTKPGKAAAGFEYVGYAADKLTIPWFAIGGIDEHNLGEVIAAGAKGVAVVRSIMQADDPQAVTAKMLAQLN